MSEILAALERNRERRQAAHAEIEEARVELTALLIRGQADSLDVSLMARQAGISRDTAHRLLREAGSLSDRQKRQQSARAS